MAKALYSTYSHISNSSGDMFIFFGEKMGNTTWLKDTTIINFGKVELNTQLLRTPRLLKKILFQKYVLSKMGHISH